MSSGKNIQRGAFVLIFSTALVKIIGALFKIPISSNYCLGDLGFGYFSVAYDLFIPISMLFISGFPSAIAKVVAQGDGVENGDYPLRVFYASKKAIIGLGLTGFVASVLLIYPFALLTGGIDNSIYTLYALSPCILFGSVCAVYRGFYSGLDNMKPTAVSNVIEALSKLVIGFSLAFIVIRLTGNLVLGATAAIVGVTLGSVLSALYLMLKFKKDKYCNSKVNKNENYKSLFIEILKIAFPMIIVSLAVNLVILGDSLTVRWQLTKIIGEYSTEFKELYKPLISQMTEYSPNLFSTVLYGIKSKAYTLYNLVPNFTAMIALSVVPSISSSFSKGNKYETENNIRLGLRLTALISFPAAAGLAALSGPIMDLIYGSGPSSAVGGKILLVYGVSAMFSGLCVVLGNVLLSLSLEKRAMVNILIGFVIKIAANLWLCSYPKINILGSAYATLIFFVVITILHLYSISKEYKIFVLLKSLIKPFIAAAMCSAAAKLFMSFGEGKLLTILSVAVGVIVYIVFNIILKTFSKDEVRDFPFLDKLLIKKEG